MPEDWGVIHSQTEGEIRFEAADIATPELLVETGDRVRFEVAQTQQGPKAVNVRLAE
jgi:cold shock CspA family protein